MNERDDRLECLRERIESGTYRVDALAVADAIVRRFRMEDVPTVVVDQSNDGSGTSDSSD